MSRNCLNGVPASFVAGLADDPRAPPAGAQAEEARLSAPTPAIGLAGLALKARHLGDGEYDDLAPPTCAAGDRRFGLSSQFPAGGLAAGDNGQPPARGATGRRFEGERSFAGCAGLMFEDGLSGPELGARDAGLSGRGVCCTRTCTGMHSLDTHWIRSGGAELVRTIGLGEERRPGETQSWALEIEGLLHTLGAHAGEPPASSPGAAAMYMGIGTAACGTPGVRRPDEEPARFKGWVGPSAGLLEAQAACLVAGMYESCLSFDDGLIFCVASLMHAIAAALGDALRPLDASP